jgi:hypothetical protein
MSERKILIRGQEWLEALPKRVRLGRAPLRRAQLRKAQQKKDLVREVRLPGELGHGKDKIAYTLHED